jgi:hypothetical protein
MVDGIMSQISTSMPQGFFFVVNFCHLVTKKKRLVNPTNEFLRFKKIKLAISQEKKLKVSRFR